MVRIEVELTSDRGDGTWTWRAAGARQPRGSLQGGVLPAGAKVGDVMRAEADFDIDGITITSVLFTKAKRPEPPRLEILPPAETPGTVPSGSGHGQPDRPGGRGGQPSRPQRRPAAGREGTPGGQARGQREGRPAREGRPSRDGGPSREGGSSRQGRPSGGRTREGATPGPGRAPREGRPSRDRGSSRQPVSNAGREGGTRERSRRLQPGHGHRNSWLEALPAEQRPVADHLLVGGIAAVRQALAEHNERARAAGQPQIKPDRVLVMAESLLPALRAAEWLDRAEAAAAMGDAVGLRDLRAVVAGADAAGRDDVARQLAASLREALDRRSNEARESWVSEVARSLDDGRVLRALRISARAPEAGTRFPAELAGRLAVAVATAMTSDTSSERWLALLEAVIASPIRQTVKPAGIPQDAVVTEAARRAVGRVPALGDLLGKPAQALRPPPPPPGPPDPSPAESGDRGDDAVVEEELEKPLTETAPGQIA